MGFVGSLRYVETVLSLYRRDSTGSGAFPVFEESPVSYHGNRKITNDVYSVHFVTLLCGTRMQNYKKFMIPANPMLVYGLRERSCDINAEREMSRTKDCNIDF